MNRKKVRILMLCLGFMLISVVVYSKIEPPPPQNLPPGPGLSLPIDGGLSFLLISGVAYGIFELKRKK